MSIGVILGQVSHRLCRNSVQALCIQCAILKLRITYDLFSSTKPAVDWVKSLEEFEMT